jgi:putative transposase
MGGVYLLPVQHRPAPPPEGVTTRERSAPMTIAELESWIALEIAGRYHTKTRRSLGVSRLAAWEAAVSKGLHRSLPSNIGGFMVNSSPSQLGISQKDRIHLFNIRNWSERPPLFAKPHESVIVRNDLRNLSRLERGATYPDFRQRTGETPY